MRGVVFVVLVLLMAPSPSYALSSPIHPSDSHLTPSPSMKIGDTSSPPLIKFILVCPGKPVESFVIANLGSCEIDLLGLRVSDGEGNLTFAVETFLRPGEVIALTTDEVEFSHFMPGTKAVPYSSLTKQGSFVLANHGDSLHHDGPQRLFAGQFRLWGFQRPHRMVRGRFHSTARGACGNKEVGP